jgi:antirestriction protein ArdC
MPNPVDTLLKALIARIDEGVLPWRQPWKAGATPTLPRRADGQPFSGSNLWILAATAAARGFVSPHWLTFAQALALGAAVRRGETGTQALLFKTRTIEGAEDGAECEEKVLRFLKVYSVFNADQIDGLPPAFLSQPAMQPERREALRDGVLDAIPAQIVYGGDRAFYSLIDDKIRLPPPDAFETRDDEAATRIHELGHWAGGPTRLNREFGRRFGDEAYAFEELVAELVAAMLGLHLETPPQTLESHASYLASWAKLLKHRPGALVEASGHAQRAVDFLLAFSRPQDAATARAA